MSPMAFKRKSEDNGTKAVGVSVIHAATIHPEPRQVFASRSLRPVSF